MDLLEFRRTIILDPKILRVQGSAPHLPHRLVGDVHSKMILSDKVPLQGQGYTCSVGNYENF